VAGGVGQPGAPGSPREPLTENAPGYIRNNYVRPEGQNVGNVSLDNVCAHHSDWTEHFRDAAARDSPPFPPPLCQFITDRPSSRVLAPPGGGSSITLG
jgi:hypothetical protein